MQQFTEFTIKLYLNGKNLPSLVNSDFGSLISFDTETILSENFIDLNFDGYKDFKIYSNGESGSGGSFYKAYIFNPNTKQFNLSNTLSGAELEADQKNKALYSHWKMGVGLSGDQRIHFGKHGQILFIETNRYEVITKNDVELLKTTYIKKIGKKTVKKIYHYENFKDGKM